MIAFLKRLAWWKRPRFYLATYGNSGLEVMFFRTKAEMEAELAEVEEEHATNGWEIDSYTWDEIPEEA